MGEQPPWDASGQQGQWQPQGPPPSGPQPSRRRRKRHLVRNILAGIVAVIVAIIVIVALSSHGTGSSPGASSSPAVANSAASPAAASSSPAAKLAKPRTVATFSGSGQENTPKFTVSDTWMLAYSFSCSNIGHAGNFAVLEDGGHLNRAEVNDVATGLSASTWRYNDAGTHYLEIDSECAWKVEVVDES